MTHAADRIKAISSVSHCLCVSVSHKSAEQQLHEVHAFSSSWRWCYKYRIMHRASLCCFHLQPINLLPSPELPLINAVTYECPFALSNTEVCCPRSGGGVLLTYGVGRENQGCSSTAAVSPSTFGAAGEC